MEEETSMRRQKKCRYCGQWYQPHPQTYRRQKSCSKPECQHESKLGSLRRWHNKNAGYDDGREEYLKEWRQAHPRDWLAYRAAHPEATRRNREQQKERDKKRRNLAKRDEWNWVHAEKLSRIRCFGDLAKRNESIQGVLRQTEEIVRYLNWFLAACKTRR
jgi:hypothetical protein